MANDENKILACNGIEWGKKKLQHIYSFKGIWMLTMDHVVCQSFIKDEF